MRFTIRGRRPPLASAALLAVILAAARPALADELRLRNGDRYTGTVVSLDAGTLAFKTPNGDLKVPWSEVTGLTVDAAIVVRTADGQTTTSSGGPIDPVSVTGLSRPQPPIVWSGGANAGLLATGGNTDVNSLRLDGELVARTRADRVTVNALVNRAEDDGDLTARNWTVSSKYDRFLTRRVYLNGSGIFTSDDFRDLDLRAALGAALGYQLFDTPLLQLAFEGGLGWVDENFATADDDSYTAARESAKLDLFVVGERLVFFHRHDGYYGVTGDDNLFFKMQNGIRLGLVAGLVTTAQVDLDYDRSPSPGRKNTDRNFALTFGYRF
jgi:putative salt-induced outer membrane protein YdiY